MKKKWSKLEVSEKIDKFFTRKDFSSEDVRKIKRLAMKYNIKLGKCRRQFCKKCLSKLRGRVRIGGIYRSIECEKCGFKNRFKIILHEV